MTTSAPPAPSYTGYPTSLKQQFADAFLRENATTRRVLTALPAGQSEFRPAPGSKTAREVATIFTRSQGRIAAALTDQWQWPPQSPLAPASYDEVIALFDATTDAVKQALATTPESRLFETVTFLTGPKQTGEIPVLQLVWFMMMDAIHHRGQFSIYLRMTGGKVPSIYGPTADEPWM